MTPAGNRRLPLFAKLYVADKPRKSSPSTFASIERPTERRSYDERTWFNAYDPDVLAA
jgi:hypothetical protein